MLSSTTRGPAEVKNSGHWRIHPTIEDDHLRICTVKSDHWRIRRLSDDHLRTCPRRSGHCRTGSTQFCICILFIKICASKTRQCKFGYSRHSGNCYNGIFSIAIESQMSPWTHQIFPSYFNLFSSPASPALSPPPFFLVRPLFYCVLLLR